MHAKQTNPESGPWLSAKEAKKHQLPLRIARLQAVHLVLNAAFVTMYSAGKPAEDSALDDEELLEDNELQRSQNRASADLARAIADLLPTSSHGEIIESWLDGCARGSNKKIEGSQLANVLCGLVAKQFIIPISSDTHRSLAAWTRARGPTSCNDRRTKFDWPTRNM